MSITTINLSDHRGSCVSDVVTSVRKLNFVEKMGNFGNTRESGGEMPHLPACKHLFRQSI